MKLNNNDQAQDASLAASRDATVVEAGTQTAALAAANRLDLVAVQAGNLVPVTLTVAGGECLVLAGASGSGKSRLLRAIADLDAGENSGNGQITLAGVGHTHYSGAEWRRRVAYVATESQWWFDDVGSHFNIMPEPEHMQALGLDIGMLQQAVSHLSSGERQRLALLRVLVQKPQVLLLDEPTASLDPKATAAVEQLITAYCQRQQAAIIWVSHDIAQARRVGQRYLHIDQGRLIDQGGEQQRWVNLDHGPTRTFHKFT